jgi:archaellum component FlaC
MDQELIAYLEERFRENSRQMQSFREETSGQMQSFREEISGQVQSFREENSRQMQSFREETSGQVQSFREEISHQIEALRQETMSRFEQVDDVVRQNKDEIRHTQIMVEAVRSDLQGVAEGVMGANERIDALREEMKQEVGKVGDRIDLSHKAHKDLNRRVRSLEEWRKRFSEAPAPRLRKKSAKKS